MRQKKREETVQRLEIIGDLDSHTAEALYLEIRRLVRRYGFEITKFQIAESQEKAGRSST